jgi:threonine synthase
MKLTSVNSINVSRILAQITYYFAAYFSLIRSKTFNPSTDKIRFAVPTGNFGDILAGYFAKRMGLPTSKLIISTNENDILHRFWQTGAYEKPSNGVEATLSPAMDILISSNFERLLWFLAYDIYGSGVEGVENKRNVAGEKVLEWQTNLKIKGGFSVEQKILDAARADFSSERVSDAETVAAIRDVYRWSKGYILDPHSAISVTAALRSAVTAPEEHCMALLTAHPAKFSVAVEKALVEEKGFQFKDILPIQFHELENLSRRVIHVPRSYGLDGIRKIVMEKVEEQLNSTTL